MAKMYRISGTYKRLFKKYALKYFPGEEKAGWLFSKLSFASKLVDFNQPWVAKLMYNIVKVVPSIW